MSRYGYFLVFADYYVCRTFPCNIHVDVDNYMHSLDTLGRDLPNDSLVILPKISHKISPLLNL